MLLAAIVNKYIGRDVFDYNIPISYLSVFLIKKMIDLIYGKIRLMTLKNVFVSPSSSISGMRAFRYGSGLIVSKNCIIDALGGITCGNNVHFGDNTTMKVTGTLKQIGKGIKIGNNVGLGTNGFYGGAGGVVIGNDCIFGNYVSIHPENHNYDDTDIPIRLQGVNHKGITIGNNCWIGAKATILDGTIIGNGCIVAAGAVVTGHFPDNVIIGGVPAKIIKSRINN